jgi:hypothetical protein
MVYAVPVNEEPSRCELSGDGNVSLCHAVMMELLQGMRMARNFLIFVVQYIAE